MTTSLPTTCPETPFATATANPSAANGLLDAFAGAFTPLAGGAESPASVGAAPDFAQLLGAGVATAPSATVAAASATAIAPAISPANVVPANGTLPTPLNKAVSVASVRSVVLHAPEATEQVDPMVETSGAAVSDEEVETTPFPERATLEAALAFAAPMLAMVAPAAPPSLAVSEETNRKSETASAPRATAPDASETPVFRVALSVPGHAPVELALPITSDPLPMREIATALATELGQPADFASVTPRSLTKSAQPLAEQVEPSRLPESAPMMPAPGAATTQAAPGVLPTKGSIPVLAVELPLVERSVVERSVVETSVELPGGAELSVQTPVAIHGTIAMQQKLTTPTRVALRFASQPQPVAEKSAASSLAVSGEKFAPANPLEKNFLNTAKPSVTPAREEAGITVAQTSPAMLFPASAPTDTAHAGAPVAALVEKMAAPTAQAPVLTQAGVSVAQRAVETVTQVVEAQAASRLQPVPSVQLRFKIGGEELAVRVELRNGEVRTEFKTDSAELRSALAQEWRAMTSRADSGVRFLDPQIAPANSPGPGSGSFSSSHQQSSSQHQQHAQQQLRASADFFGSIGRSFAPTTDTDDAPAAVAPLVLSTSHRLSAIA